MTIRLDINDKDSTRDLASDTFDGTPRMLSRSAHPVIYGEELIAGHWSQRKERIEFGVELGCRAVVGREPVNIDPIGLDFAHNSDLEFTQITFVDQIWFGDHWNQIDSFVQRSHRQQINGF